MFPFSVYKHINTGDLFCSLVKSTSDDFVIKLHMHACTHVHALVSFKLYYHLNCPNGFKRQLFSYITIIAVGSNISNVIHAAE